MLAYFNKLYMSIVFHPNCNVYMMFTIDFIVVCSVESKLNMTFDIHIGQEIKSCMRLDKSALCDHLGQDLARIADFLLKCCTISSVLKIFIFFLKN